MREFDLLSELPPPRSDEPQSLRQDIADELADHLACATQHKMIGGLDTETAWKQAVLQFGNPQQTARQLWWQAMRNRIMSQRLTIVFTGLAMTACATMLVIVLMMQQQMQLQTQQQASLMETMQGFQEGFNKSQENLSLTAPAQFRVELKTNSDTPLVPNDARVELIGLDLTNKDVSGKVFCDAVTGRADFGHVPPGRYKIFVSYVPEYYTEKIELHGGESYIKSIVCDRKDLSKIPLEIDFKMPPRNSLARLKEKGLVVFAGFVRQPKVIQSFVWKPLADTQFLGVFKTDERLVQTTLGLSDVPSPMNEWEKHAFFAYITPGPSSYRAQEGLQEYSRISGLSVEDRPVAGWTYRLERIGILSEPEMPIGMGGGMGGFVSYTNSTVVIWDQSHPHFPAWAKEPGHVFVVSDKASNSPSQRSLPWQIEVPAELIDEALAASNPESPTN